jgi:hypothetical protein
MDKVICILGELKESKAYRQWGAEVMKTRAPANPLKRPSKYSLIPYSVMLYAI